MPSIRLEYTWLDNNGSLRSKTKIITNLIPRPHTLPQGTLWTMLDSCPDWDYDGSSTGQATGNNSEVILKPVAIYRDPFRKDIAFTKSYLVLCDTWLPNGTSHPTNYRVKAQDIFDKAKQLEPMFGIEQEFFLSVNDQPIGIQENSKCQGNYYCGAGADNIFGRPCIEEILTNCEYAGIHLTGLNAEVAPSQWEFQICHFGIDVCDEVLITRYIINRTAEKYGWNIDIRAKPIKTGDWNGSGCHTNFSTKPMREENGIAHIHQAINNLSKKQDLHIKWYGDGNKERLTGKHETASYEQFSFGVADRSASIRIPNRVKKENKGYFEDRRPSSSMNPYIVTSLLFATSCGIEQNHFT